MYWTFFFYLRCNYSWSVITIFSETMVFSVSLAFSTFLFPTLYVHGEAYIFGSNKNNNNWNFRSKENFSCAFIWFILQNSFVLKKQSRSLCFIMECKKYQLSLSWWKNVHHSYDKFQWAFLCSAVHKHRLLSWWSLIIMIQCSRTRGKRGN